MIWFRIVAPVNPCVINDNCDQLPPAVRLGYMILLGLMVAGALFIGVALALFATRNRDDD